MKKTVLILLMAIVSCGYSQTFIMHEGDTINVRDVNNKKQGVWLNYDKSKKLKEKGKYFDNKKEGLWLGYYPSGKLKHEITYLKNRPDGPAKFYYENGIISEQGIWKINKWVGEYKYFHENGNLAYDWKYNETGKRTGQQKYYYTDGSMMYDGDWTNGKKEGKLTEYFPDGSIKSEMDFASGKLNVATIKEYELAEKPSIKQLAPKTQKVIPQKSTAASYDAFTRTGDFKTFNEFKKIDREGHFVKGKLYKGKRYFYNDKGELVKTLVYDEGKVVKVIDETLE